MLRDADLVSTQRPLLWVLVAQLPLRSAPFSSHLLAYWGGGQASSRLPRPPGELRQDSKEVFQTGPPKAPPPERLSQERPRMSQRGTAPRTPPRVLLLSAPLSH